MSNVAYNDYNVVFVYMRLHCVVDHDVGVVSAGIVAIFVITTIDLYYTSLYYTTHGHFMMRLTHTRCVVVICIVHSSCVYVYKLYSTPPIYYTTLIYMCIMLHRCVDVKKRISII